MQKKVTDFIAEFFVENNIKHVFMLTGGGAMHLNNSFGKHPGLEIICNHHEQASSMAAESYARLAGNIAALNVTTGPGGLNTLNGVFGAWVDSLPIFVVSGQVKTETTTYSTTVPLRQLGDQECRIIDMVKGITKYAYMVTDPNEILYHLQKALYLAKTGRPGPVWIDVPMNVQGSFIDTNKLTGFSPEKALLDQARPFISDKIIASIMQKLGMAKRPVIMVGAGIRLSGMHNEFLKLIDALKIPVVTCWNAHDTLHDDHACHAGKPGTIGDRAGNFVVQNSDVLLILGSRLNIRQISYNWESFAKSAYKIMVDVDEAELNKPTLSIDMPVHANLKDFIPKLSKAVCEKPLPNFNEWMSWCKERKEKYPIVLKEYWNNPSSVNPYCFMEKLSQYLPENQIIVTGDGTACVTSFQTIKLKLGQRLYTNSGCASMGYDVPAAIGACIAARNKDIICLAGDGSIMQNIQELAVIASNNYPIKILLLNNNGYHSIRQTQQNFFGQPLVGVGPDSGLGFPDFSKLIAGFGLPYLRCSTHSELDESLAKVMEHHGPIVCEVMIDLNQQFAPKLSSRQLEDGTFVTSSLEDMAPFLSREELKQNMLIKD